MQSNFFQVWADEGDSDDWQCVQTLGEPNKYYFLNSLINPDFVFSFFKHDCLGHTLCRMTNFLSYMLIWLQLCFSVVIHLLFGPSPSMLVETKWLPVGMSITFLVHSWKYFWHFLEVLWHFDSNFLWQ